MSKFASMKAKTLTYYNHLTGWNVKDLNFDTLTLLVGASGVGKTQILHSILNLSRIANGKSVNGAEWKIIFEIDDAEYVWEGSFETKENDYQEIISIFSHHSEYNIVSEKLSKNGTTIIDRNSSRILFLGKETVKLDSTKSALALLKEEEAVESVFKAFRRIYQLRNREDGGLSVSLFNFEKSAMTIDEIKQLHVSPSDKLFLLKKNKMPQFDEILEEFRSIFPLVENLDFEMANLDDKHTFPVLKMKEKNVAKWIFAPDISSGMMRTLNQIITLVTANNGDIILLDEFENGLGINCIDQLADSIFNPDSDIQVIMTSHHPYIINNIPYSTWRVVTRKGSDVTIHTADELKIGNWSKHDAFIQLSNTKAFQTGES